MITLPLVRTIALTVVLTLQTYAQKPPEGEERTKRWERPEDGRGPGREMVREDIMQELARNPEMLQRLELSPEQIDNLKAAREKTREQMDGIRKNIAAYHKELSELMAKPESSDEALRVAFEKTITSEAEMRRLIFETRLEIRKILGPEKTQRLQRLARDVRPEREEEGRPMLRRERDGETPPPWMRDGGERIPGRRPAPPQP